MVSKHLLTEQAQKAGGPGSPRLDNTVRRNAIVDAALPLFARKGFAATTTREIAAAAGVSEALIFKHFPSKAALYEAIFSSCLEGDAELDRLLAMPPSTGTLVEMIRGLVGYFLTELPDSPAEMARHRLYLMSHLEDGEFARMIRERVDAVIQPAFSAAFEVARNSGDVVGSPLGATDALRLSHHLCAMLGSHFLSGPAAALAQYRGPAAERTVAWVLLRGMGLRDEALARHLTTDDRADDGRPDGADRSPNE